MADQTKNSGGHGRKFGTFGGVFTPDVLTILGVIMYLRLGWVVGNVGFTGALIIILLAKSVTICTGLSMSSITTNIKIGAGGAYSILAKSLGLEAGGSIGIPLYISQTLSAALYVMGFTQAWILIFPGHHPTVVAVAACLILLLVSYISAHFAIKIQYIIMAVMAVSLLSFFLTPAGSGSAPVMLGTYRDASFWQVFAIFFPAVTGIMAGANMSGDLKNPRRSIPVGTMTAIGITMLIYIGLAWMLSRIATPEELRADEMIMVSKSLFAPAVIAGIMGATLSSALGSMLGAPRILQALAEHRIVPFSKFLSAKTRSNEPRNAIVVTGVFIIGALVLGNLNAIASLITMFFLITYGMLNLVVFLEQSLKFISFRPTFKIPRAVPLLGGLACVFIMFLIDPFFSIIASVIIIILYVWLARRGLHANWGDIRGGLFLVLAERASRISAKFPRHHISWKPDLLLPVDDPEIWSGPMLFIRNITYPSGSIFAFTVRGDEPEETQHQLDELLVPLQKQGILINATVIEERSFLHGTKLVMQVLKGGAFRPNTLFLTLSNDSDRDATLRELVNHATSAGLGTILLRQHPRVAFGMQKDVNIWLRDKSPNWHLAMLLTLQLQLNWGGRINLVTVASQVKDELRMYRFLERLSDQARLPSMTEFHVVVGNFHEAITRAPRADVNIFGLANDRLEFSFMREVPELVRSSCVFVKDSGQENALV